MKLNFKNQKVFKGHATQAFIVMDESQRPIHDATFTLSGNSSCDTYVCDNRVIIAKDELSKKITLTASKNGENAIAVLTVCEETGIKTEFDDDSVILCFGLTSDTHISGSWNQPRSTAKWIHCIKALQEAAGRNPDGSTKLCAFTCTGDFVDAVNSFGNVNSGIETYGTKGAQNYREVSFLRSGLEGRETNRAESSAQGKPAISADFGKGLEKGVEFFYCLGNHDERGKGQTSENERFTRVYSAEYFTAVMCGWEYDSKKGDNTPDLCDSSYRQYARDLYHIHIAQQDKRDELIKAFTNTHGIDGNYAYDRFRAYYGKDTDFTAEEHGLFFGNRHTVINGIHFIAIEVSQCAESAKFLDKWCARSVEEDERKPIIVLTHEKVYHTIDSSVPKKNDPDSYMSTPGHTGLLEVLAKYPQAFVWTGHTHSVLTNANAIMSDCGFTAVEGSVLAYLSCEGLIGRGETPAGNYCRKEDHDNGPCCLIKVDADYNVKIEKIDVHRSYKEEFGTANRAVFFADPWIISGISSSGEHLLKYSAERGFECNNNAPTFPDDAKVTIRYLEGNKLCVSFPHACEDGSDVVKYYKIQLENVSDPNDRPMQYATSFAFKYSNEAELAEHYPSYSIEFPAVKESRVSDNLERCVALSTPTPGAKYKAYVTAYDSWNKKSKTIVSE